LPGTAGVVLAALVVELVCVVWLVVELVLVLAARVVELVLELLLLLLVLLLVLLLLLPPQPAISAAQSVATRNSGRNLRIIVCPLSIAARGRRLRRSCAV
jgi:hypothetical protein